MCLNARTKGAIVGQTSFTAHIMILRVLAAIVMFAIVGDAFAFQHVSILNIRHSRICRSTPPVSQRLRRSTIIPRCCVNTEQKDSAISEKQAQFDFYVSVGSAKQCVPILRKNDDIKVSQEQVPIPVLFHHAVLTIYHRIL